MNESISYSESPTRNLRERIQSILNSFGGLLEYKDLLRLKNRARNLGETKSASGSSWGFLTLRCLQYGLFDLPNKGLNLAFMKTFEAMGMGKGYERGLRWGGKLVGGFDRKKKEDKG